MPGSPVFESVLIISSARSAIDSRRRGSPGDPLMPDRIDAWTHIFPQAYFERLQTMASAAGPLKRWLELKSLYDLDHRFRLMDGFVGYRQVLTPSMPAIEDLADGQAAVELMRLMNDGLAELVSHHPDRFPAFAAALSLHDVDAAVAEIARAEE